uniref:Uncharacterized protein n=1 Tax=Hordeum vulgare subsp. vulgare TaxID=112509 RepID=A0A8I6YGL3_HORVV
MVLLRRAALWHDRLPFIRARRFNRGFYLNLNGTYIGVGMIRPYLINISMLVGAILSWGFLWPYIETKNGSWYAANLQEGSLRGPTDYDEARCNRQTVDVNKF